MSKVEKKENSSAQDDTNFAYKTVIRSVILSGLFLISSFIFNGEIIKLYEGSNEFLIILDALFKVILIMLFFICSIISIGNYKELSGKPLKLKEILLLSLFSLLQGYRNPLVIVFTFFGIMIMIVYFYMSQE